jgi:hypothetical protein
MMREYQVRFCEGLGVKFPGSTRPRLAIQDVRVPVAIGDKPENMCSL